MCAAFVQQAARRTAGSCGYGAVGAVVGATYPEQLAELRQAMPNTWFLVPGFGAQGPGRRTCAHAFAADGLGADRQQLAWHHLRLRTPGVPRRFGGPVAAGRRSRHPTMIEQLRSETPAGRL